MNTDQLYKTIQLADKANAALMIWGSPALGKSSIVKQYAEDNELHLVDFRLAQCSVTDLRGFPNIKADSDKAVFLPPKEFILEEDKIPNGKKGVLLFFDEISSASKNIQAASYQIVLDRVINQTPLHPNTTIVCAGNLLTDGAVVNKMSTALVSRMMHVTLDPNVDTWLKWAALKGVHNTVRSYIGFRRQNLYTFKPDLEGAYSSPRTWEMVSELMYEGLEKTPELITPILTGLLGKGVANEFKIFMNEAIPSVSELMNNPEKVKLPANDPGFMYALSGLVTSICEEMCEMTKEEESASKLKVDSLRILLDRMPSEFRTKVIKSLLLGEYDEIAEENRNGMDTLIVDKCSELSDILFG